MGANFGGAPTPPYDPADVWNAEALNGLYSQQPYQQQAQVASQYSGLLGSLCTSVGATAYAFVSGIGGYSGMGMQQYNAQLQEMQTMLGTPSMPKPKLNDPEEILWLKGRVKEVMWQP